MDDGNNLNSRIVIRDCPGCGKRIVFSASGDSNNDPIMVSCPYCSCNCVFLNDELYLYATSVPVSSSEKEIKSARPKTTKVFSHQKKKRIIRFSIALGLAAVIGLGIYFWANRHIHSWTDATCVEPKTCSVCGETEGSPKGHSWQPATCTAPETCIVCGATQGSPVAHSWKAASCTAPKTCSACGKTEGSPSGHKWKDATCTKPKTCSACGKTDGNALDHDWSKETLNSPSTCSRCGEMLPMTTPKTGQVYIGANLACPSEITINASSQSVYVKLKNSSGKDVFTFFARAFQTTTVPVPSGNYRVYFAQGNDWYGPKYCFGDSTSYSKDSELLDFNHHSYSYTMYPVTNGNFKETPVSKSEFD